MVGELRAINENASGQLAWQRKSATVVAFLNQLKTLTTHHKNKQTNLKGFA